MKSRINKPLIPPRMIVQEDVWAQTQLLQPTRPERINQHIRIRDELEQEISSFGNLSVDSNRSLPATEDICRFGLPDAVDSCYRRAKVGEDHAREGTRRETGELCRNPKLGVHSI